MIKTAQELKEQAEKIGLTFYPIHRCSICGYDCGYIINGDEVFYDSGCHCVYRVNIKKRSWEDLADCYNLNQPENNPNVKQRFLDKLDSVWEFDEKK